MPASKHLKAQMLRNNKKFTKQLKALLQESDVLVPQNTIEELLDYLKDMRQSCKNKEEVT